MELTPLIQPGRQISGHQVIERYGVSGFRISGTVYLGPVLVFPDRTLVWHGAALIETAFAPVVEQGGVELLLVGVGRRMAPVPAPLRALFKAHGIAIEAMETGAACRTYNVLLAEDRRVAAALLPPV
ncbi:MAG TPA: Mth938-like domain-containing protein [Stellaceae bacterium]|nr:Mth938-like domain-containing protein [Stellaceae bacterium]